MSHIIGRGRYARETYPERQSSSSSGQFARNFATGPALGTDIGPAGVQVPWNAIDVGAPGVNVPITPVATGVVRVFGNIVLQNNVGDSQVSGIVVVQVGGVAVAAPFSAFTPINGDETVTIPFLAETTPADTPVGVTTNIQVFVDADGGTLLASRSVVDVSEVPASTG